ncbi:MAG: hypothetical protein AB7Q69_17860 [Gemmatimonadales bacterium]
MSLLSLISLRAARGLALFSLPSGLLLLAACDSGRGAGPGSASGPSMAFGIWQPGPNDTCTGEIHDQYSVVGPDGKLYPTWHPPVDPATGCTFGHEHGRDPRGSDLFQDVGLIPFGYANEVQDLADPGTMRHEDHVGHKIEWENDIEVQLGDGLAGQILTITCDVMVKLHQGTHSKDAFTNNMHELAYHIECTDGTAIHFTVLTPIGTPGEFERSCDRQTIAVGPATPPTSPNGGGRRIIPDRGCIDQFVLVPAGQNSQFGSGIHESWEVSVSLRAEDGRTLAHVNPYFQVDNPSRFYDPALPNATGRVIDVCYETESNGDQARGGLCDQSTNNGQIQGVTYDDPRSLFDGTRRFVDINDNQVDNANGPQVWYTDPLGRHGSPRAFTGSIRQRISKIDNDYGFQLQGPVIGRNRRYGGNGVHAPN